MIVVGQVIRIIEISTIIISLANSNIIKLQNMILVSDYNLNFISLGQLQEGGNTYYDNPTVIILIKKREIIVLVKRKKNIVIDDLVGFSKAIATIS